MFVYHVTTESRVDNILNSSLSYKPVNANWVKERARFRKLIDRRAKNVKSNWIPRVGAIYFWSDIADAKKYAEVRESNSPVILKINAKNLNIYSINNNYIEDLYKKYLNNIDVNSDEFINDIDYIINQSYKWNNHSNAGHELWTQPPVNSTKIEEVIEYR